MTIEDPDTYNQPWQAIRSYRRIQGTLAEEACAENNQHLFDYHITRHDFRSIRYNGQICFARAGTILDPGGASSWLRLGATA